MDTAPDLSARDLALAYRAAAHCLPGREALRNGVTDLDVARLMLKLERGAVIVPGAGGRSWHEKPRGKAMPPLARIVAECLRVGLVHQITVHTAPDVVLTRLEAAVVHYGGRGRTLCSASALQPSLRFRIVDEIELTDCAACQHLYR